MNVKGPTVQTEADYAHSVAVSITSLRRILTRYTPEAARYKGPVPPLANLDTAYTGEQGRRDPNHPLPNRDLDTGKVVRAGGYRLTDSTYAELSAQASYRTQSSRSPRESRKTFRSTTRIWICPSRQRRIPTGGSRFSRI